MEVIRFNLPAEAREAVGDYCVKRGVSPSDYYRDAIDAALEAASKPNGRIIGMPLHAEKQSACVRLDDERAKKVRAACQEMGRDRKRACPVSQWIAAAVCKRALRFYCSYQKPRAGKR